VSFAESSAPVVRHLIACERVAYDADNPVAPYSIHGVLSVLGPELASGYPLSQPAVWLFAEFQGNVGHYQVWVDLVRVDDESGDEAEVATYGPWVLLVRPELYAESRGWCLRKVPFPEPGVYEIRVRCGADLLAVERILLTEE
jgi:hypothetical protein